MEKVRVSTFKKWWFATDFSFKQEDDRVVEATCNYCPLVPYNKFMVETAKRGLKGKVLISAQSYRSSVSYIHKPTLARHVGNEKSLHQWCKKEVLVNNGEVYVPPVQQETASQTRIDTGIATSSYIYFEKLFRTVLYLVEEEIAFAKLKSLMTLQMNNGLKFGSTDKWNNQACREIVDILAEVIRDIMKGYFREGNFLALSGDASEARKTSEEKELVFGKILVKGKNGYVPCMFLLKCQSLKEFGGGTAKGTYEAMINACCEYIDEADLKQMLVCMAADGASVNFGKYNGALNKMAEFVGWDVFRIHCANHRLELSMKDSFKENNAFANIQEMLDVLFRLFRNSGKSWRIYQLLGEKMSVSILRFLRCGGTRFQAHVRGALTNFIRNFLVSVLFAENVEEHGNGNDRIVTKEMYPKIVGFRKKWSKFEFIATVNLYFEVLKETAHLSLLLESDGLVIYQLADAVKEVYDNLDDLRDAEDYDYLPFNIEKIKEYSDDDANWLLRDCVQVKISASSCTLNMAEKLKQMGPEERAFAENKIKVVKETFDLRQVKSGTENVDKLRKDFIPEIKEKIRDRFSCFNEDEAYKSFQLFNVALWGIGEDTELIVAEDGKNLEILAKCFEAVLSTKKFNIKEAKKEWRKVTISYSL